MGEKPVRRLQRENGGHLQGLFAFFGVSLKKRYQLLCGQLISINRYIVNANIRLSILGGPFRQIILT